MPDRYCRKCRLLLKPGENHACPKFCPMCGVYLPSDKYGNTPRVCSKDQAVLDANPHLCVTDFM